MMHPGYLNQAYVSPAGPVDPELSVLSVVSHKDEQPLCVLANFSMHYFGSSAGFSADYFGEVATSLETSIAETDGVSNRPFVGIMSQGTSGDLHWMNYGMAQRNVTRSQYAHGIADKVLAASRKIEHRSDCTLAMAEKRIQLRRRVPDAARLAWAKTLNEQRGDRVPKDRPEVYAQQAQWIHEHPEAEVVLQAVRIGDIAIAAMPNEVYGITGLKLKLQSPLENTFNLELANGAEGYIPPPEQHRLGGYTTWPARTAGLEVEAEPKIVETVLSLLESVAGKPRRQHVEPENEYANTIVGQNPIAYWPLDDLTIEKADDAMGKHSAAYDGAVALYLPMPKRADGQALPGRCVYFAGGSLQASIANLPGDHSLTMCFWNGLPVESERDLGTLFSRRQGDLQETLSIMADDDGVARLAFASGSNKAIGSTPLVTRAWHHVILVRNADGVTIYLDGQPEIELAIDIDSTARSVASDLSSMPAELSFGEFDGKLDELALFGNAFSADRAMELYRASGMKAPQRPPRPVVLDEKPSAPESLHEYSEAVKESKPVAYWRLHDDDNSVASDAMGAFHGHYEPGAKPRRPGSLIRNFTGGRAMVRVPELENRYSIELWMRNETRNASRPVTGYMFTRGMDGAEGAQGDSLGIGGTHAWSGRLFVFNGNQRADAITGKTTLVTGGWNHVVMTREDARVKVYLNGELEIDGPLAITYPDGCEELQIGGRNDNFANFQGMIDEVALYDRVLSPREVQTHFVTAAAETIGRPTKELDAESRPTPTPAEASLRKIHIRDGYRVQLVASEPQVKDPVAIDWGHDGTLWVVEMADYPLGMDGKGKPGGRIRKLQDRDGDGTYESSTLFAEGLSFPNGILVWGEGILVTAAPEILYLEDSDGDGKADIRRPLYRGFLEGNQQLRVNGLRRGLDNWVHCASGSHHSGYGKGNRITSLATGERNEIGSRDFRIRPDTGAIDPLSGPSQFGRNRDDWGNWFGVQNSRPLWHYVLADADIRRNPHFAPPDPIRQVVTPLNPPVYPAAKLQKRFHSFDQSGRFTSACSGMVYRDDLLFERDDRDQHAFTCEPFHNLVQHNIITHDGVSFGFRRDAAETNTDFFASEDRWCRPVMVRTGPDGALWVVDMYRYMIEHPQWLPENGKDELRPYYRLGEEHGRIYRVVPDGTVTALDRPRSGMGISGNPEASEVSVKELVSTLESPNGWQRDFAQQALIRRNDRSVVKSLQHMAATGKSPLSRLHALCTLDGMESLTADVLTVALADPHPGVRRQAVRLARDWPAVQDALVEMVGDDNAKVRLQLAATLGRFEDPKASAALAHLAASSAGDPFVVANVMSSLTEQNIGSVLRHYVSNLSNSDAVGDDQLRVRTQLFSQVAALGKRDSIGNIIEMTCDSAADRSWRYNGLADLLDGIAKRGMAWDEFAEPSQHQIVETISEARSSLVQERELEAHSALLAATRLLLRQTEHFPSDVQILSRLLVPQVELALQLAAADRLGDQPNAEIANVLLDGWASYGPLLRARVLDVLSSRTSWSRSLLERVESKQVSTAELDSAMRSRLMSTRDKALQADWRRALAASTASDRKKVIDAYQPALSMTGNVDRGAKVFAQHCASCHRMGKTGHEVGPNLASITDKSPASLLTSILDPSSAVEARYMAYLVLTDDGRVHNGLLATETGSSLTLLTNEGKTKSILRSEIEEIRASGKSLMPDGLEKEITPQAMADLILLLRSSQPAAG